MEKILLDTNIFIYLEDNKITDDKIIKLTKNLFDSDKYKIVIHPKSKFEIEKMKDKEKKEIFKSKIAVYKEISNPPVPNKEFHELVGCKNGHDEIDNTLLFSVKRNCVSYLITNDTNLKKKSSIVGLSDRVLTIDEALEKFRPDTIDFSKTPPFIEEKFLYELDIEDPFFDSLKDDYSGFTEWFVKKQIDDVKAYVTFNKKRITSFLMLKKEDEKEDYSNFSKPFEPKKRLKVSTLKVSDTGKKIGETFIKLIVQKALDLNVEEIYVTVFDKQSQLIDLLNEYGFKYYCYKNTNRSNGEIIKENIYVKQAKPIDEYYPFIRIDDRKVFLVPIKEKYHNLLFREYEKNVQLSIYDLDGLNTSSNCLKKAYLCDSKIKQITPGSILLFYSSGKKRAITSLGIVDATFDRFDSFEEMYRIIRKRTAYEDIELRKNYKDDKLVILFKTYYSFENYVSFDFLLKNNIVKGNIQSITQISNDKLEMILDESKIEKEKYFIS